MMDKERELHNLIYLLRKQFFIGDATTNVCSSKDCEERVRGTGHCERCLTKEIIALTGGMKPGIMLRRALGFQNEAIVKLMELIEDK